MSLIRMARRRLLIYKTDDRWRRCAELTFPCAGEFQVDLCQERCDIDPDMSWRPTRQPMPCSLIKVVGA